MVPSADPEPRRDPRAGAPSSLALPAAPWIDSHAHLAGEEFDADRDAAIARVREAGGQGVVCIGESLAAAARARAVAAAHPGFVWWTAGVHPHDAAGYDPARDLDALRECMAAGAVAVGECGLDYHYDHSPRAQQRRAFADQLALAQETGRPVVVHTREAEDDTGAMVREAGSAGITGILHCFTGSHALAEVGLAAGWYVSFSGIVTFRKWTDEALLRLVPDDSLLVESDSPYLAPVPFRGKRNEPAWCAHTLARLAAARGTDPALLGARIVENTRHCFRLR
ncbi:MAG: TatD family hydrolase [Gemmatimonadetes bacterium]|nr:TatD family hydrolase [Gemmatimonadota bacterium]